MARVDHRWPLMSLALLALLWLWPIGAARAQALQIMPVRVDFQHGQQATTVLITNRSDERQTVQVRPFRWDQESGADALLPTAALAVSPPIAMIDPGAAQVFRLVLRQPAIGMEGSYRLLFDQLPAPAPPGTIQVALRLSVPVFAHSALRARGGIVWGVVRDGDGAVLSATNQGTDHMRITRTRLTQDGGPVFAVPGAAAAYILPGAAQSWRIEGGGGLQPGSTVRLTATSDQGPVDAAVHVSGP